VTDSIALSGLEVYARHGALPHEASHAQPFVIDVVVSADLSEAGASDRLGATIDYGELAGRIHDVVASERWQLIERVAERVASIALSYPRCSQVEVTVHKPRAPIGVPFDDVAVTIQRSR
jgi:dihydroneopterin aldolase